MRRVSSVTIQRPSRSLEYAEHGLQRCMLCTRWASSKIIISYDEGHIEESVTLCPTCYNIHSDGWVRGRTGYTIAEIFEGALTMGVVTNDRR